jgi:hypothetical protein
MMDLYLKKSHLRLLRVSLAVFLTQNGKKQAKKNQEAT